MNKRVQAFLTELYEIDPALKQSEQELVGLIEMLLKHNPGQEADERFVETLRMKLRERGADLSSKRTSFFPSFLMPKFSYGILGAFLGVIITGPAVYYLVQGGGNSVLPLQGSDTSMFSYKVTPTSNRAFGDLSTVTSGGGMGGGARTQSGGGGGGAPAIDAAMPQAAEMVQRDGDAANSKMMIYPPDYTINQFNYVYKGEELQLPTGDVSVLKRLKNAISIPGLGALANADLGIFSMSAFPNLQLDNISAYQTTKDGYSIYVALREGSISVSQNYETWDHPESRCTTEACYQQMRVKIGDVPSDDVMIGIANDFLEKYGFELENVGAPYVDNGWKQSYENTTDKSQFWVPDQISVVYPHQLDGKDVFEEYGGKAGVSVSIDIRNKKVAGVWNLHAQSYQSSNYPAVTDKQQVLDFLANYEKMRIDPLAEQNGMKTQTFDVELGTPTMGFVRMYKYTDNTNDELFVPALVFPVTKAPEGKDLYYSRQSIAVPLAKELLEEQLKRGGPMPVDGPTLRIMEDAPAAEDAPADDAATSGLAE